MQLVDARDFWVKMRRSLGEKRKQINDDQIAEVTRLYADFRDGERVRIFPNEAFGYQRIVVERPLRLRWEVTDETLAAVAASKSVAKLDDEAREKLLDALGRSRGNVFRTLSEACAAVAPVLSGAGLIGKPTEKAVLDALAVRDPEAPVITDAKGNPEPDPELRDHENVPLPPKPVQYEADPSERLQSPEYRTVVDEYMQDEVLPFVPDARVDHSKTRIGYEMPATRHFYKYSPPRPLEEIDAEIKALEAEVQEMLQEVTE